LGHILLRRMMWSEVQARFENWRANQQWHGPRGDCLRQQSCLAGNHSCFVERILFFKGWAHNGVGNLAHSHFTHLGLHEKHVYEELYTRRTMLVGMVCLKG